MSGIVCQILTYTLCAVLIVETLERIYRLHGASGLLRGFLSLAAVVVVLAVVISDARTRI